MICFLEEKIDLANFVDLYHLMVNAKGESQGNASVCMIASADFSVMAPGENLYLLAHGNQLKAGPFTGPELATKLLSRNLPGHIKKIVMMSCFSGDSMSRLHQVVAQQLKDLSRGAVDVPVKWFTGPSATDRYGKTRAINMQIVPKFETEMDALAKKWKQKIAEWEALASAQPAGNQEEIIRASRLLAEASKDYIAEQIVFNAKVAHSKADGRGYARAV